MDAVVVGSDDFDTEKIVFVGDPSRVSPIILTSMLSDVDSSHSARQP